MTNIERIEELKQEKNLPDEDFKLLLENMVRTFIYADLLNLRISVKMTAITVESEKVMTKHSATVSLRMIF